MDMIIPAAIIALAMLAAGIVRRRLWITRVRSESMTPSLRPGDRLLTRAVRDPSRVRRGDVAVIDSRELNRRIIKRVVGLPGERVVVTGEHVVVNGVLIDEPWPRIPGGPVGSFLVPDDALLVLGDNRALSSDSRSWRDPYVTLASVVGTVVGAPRFSPASYPRLVQFS